MTLTLAFRHDVGNFRSIIARVTGAPVHVALCFGDAVVIEADGAAVHQTTRAALVSRGQWTMVACHVDAGQADRAFAFARQQIGKPYNWLGVLVAWWAGRGAGNGATDEWFCSQLAAATLMAAGVPMGHARAAFWTPRRLWDWVQPWR